MLWFVILIAVYKLLTCRLFYGAYQHNLQVRQLASQIEAIRQAHVGDPVAVQQDLNSLYKTHGINQLDGCLVRLVDVAFFLIALTCFAPTKMLDGVSFLWVQDVTRYSGSILLVWLLVSLAYGQLARRHMAVSQAHGQLIAGVVLLFVILSGLAWYWQWPAYVFVFWILVNICNLLGDVCIWLAYFLASVSPTSSTSVSTPPPPTQASQPQPVAQPTPAIPQPAPSPTPVPSPPSPALPVDASKIQPLLPLQPQIDGTSVGGTLTLDPLQQQLQGPAVIRQPITIDGGGSTLWVVHGPVLRIESDGVTLQNLAVEVTDPDDTISGSAAVALAVEPGRNVLLRNVAVRGYVTGIVSETGDWRYPRLLRLGTLRAGRSHEFRLRLVTAVACELVSEIAGVRFDPDKIPPGANEVALKINDLPEGTLLRGVAIIQTPLLARRIELNGKADSRTSPQTSTSSGSLLYEPSDWTLLTQKPAPTASKDKSRATLGPIEDGSDPAKAIANSRSVCSASHDTEPTHLAQPPASDKGRMEAEVPQEPKKDPMKQRVGDEARSKKTHKRRILRPGRMSGLFAEGSDAD